ncbi:MAG: hypothetical protein ABI166_03125 [Mucilaginibacter sp.]
MSTKDIEDIPMADLKDYFNQVHEKFVCTASKVGEPNVCLMGTARISEAGAVEFEISDLISVTLDNILENKFITFMAYLPGPRARDYTGVRIYAEVTEIMTSGEKLEVIRESLRARFGEEKAAELRATVSCRINRLRPVVDRGQTWNVLPFAPADHA